MKVGLYAIVDAKAGQAIGVLHQQRHDAVAVRMFSDLYADQQTFVHRHPSDFSLQRVGVFDDETLIVEGHDPVVVVTGEAVAAMAAQKAQAVTDA